jgi:hypothetical protein
MFFFCILFSHLYFILIINIDIHFNCAQILISCQRQDELYAQIEAIISANTGSVPKHTENKECYVIWAENNNYIVPWVYAEDLEKMPDNSPIPTYPNNCGMYSESTYAAGGLTASNGPLDQQVMLLDMATKTGQTKTSKKALMTLSSTSTSTSTTTSSSSRKLMKKK